MLNLIDLKNYRIIDLSTDLHSGILTVNGEYVHGREARRFEIRQFIYKPDKTLMHWVETETHIGTHVELPAHYIQGGKSAGEMPVESFMGEAVVLSFDFLKPRDGKRQPIKVEHLSKVREGDILLMWSHLSGDWAPYISSETAKWLAERPIKMLGIQNIRLEESLESMATHRNMLRNGIPVIEGLVNLDMIKKDRIFYIGLPLRVHGLDSSWIRAIALEQK